MRYHADFESVDRLVDLRVCISEEKTRDVQQYLLMIDDLYRDPKVGSKDELNVASPLDSQCRG